MEGITRTMAAFSNPERRANGSTAEQIAEVVWEAVHDESPKVTFVAGADAKATYGQRLSAGVEAFRAGIRQMFLGS